MAVVPSFEIIESEKDHCGAESMNLTSYTTNPLMLICPRKIESQRTFAIDLRSTEPAFIVEDPLLVWALTALPKRFLKDEAVAVWTREGRAKEHVDEIWNFVTAERLVVPVDELNHLGERYESWNSGSWADAVVYHEGTRDYPFV
ncbi:MAG: hypothetical protein K2X81_27750, partial [Candidatus Obscuribacterales bacterium]|nr:hypothetical protein [Candidatus Obscuribacterales bacterium]